MEEAFDMWGGGLDCELSKLFNNDFQHLVYLNIYSNYNIFGPLTETVQFCHVQ